MPTFGPLLERHAVLMTDEASHQALIAAGQAKYGAPFHGSWTSGITDYFRLDPPQGATPEAPASK